MSIQQLELDHRGQAFVALTKNSSVRGRTRWPETGYSKIATAMNLGTTQDMLAPESHAQWIEAPVGDQYFIGEVATSLGEALHDYDFSDEVVTAIAYLFWTEPDSPATGLEIEKLSTQAPRLRSDLDFIRNEMPWAINSEQSQLRGTMCLAQ